MIELLLDVARRDDRLHQALLLKADCAGDDMVMAYRRAIDGATRIHQFVDWREAGSVAGNVDQVVESLADLLKPDTAATLVELAE